VDLTREVAELRVKVEFLENKNRELKKKTETVVPPAPVKRGRKPKTD